MISHSCSVDIVRAFSFVGIVSIVNNVDIVIVLSIVYCQKC